MTFRRGDSTRYWGPRRVLMDGFYSEARRNRLRRELIESVPGADAGRIRKKKMDLVDAVGGAVIITVRYRDIPYEEAIRCLTPEGFRVSEALGGIQRWNKLRGRTARIITPATHQKQVNFSCEGPFFRGADQPEYGLCAHVAEIGD